MIIIAYNISTIKSTVFGTERGIVIISEAEYNELARAKRNAEYLAKLDESFKQFDDGKTISFSMEELREMESDDWKPTQKVLDWMKRMENISR